jgi:hypothetical protein
MPQLARNHVIRLHAIVLTAMLSLAALLLSAPPSYAAAPSRPGTVVSPLATGAGCIIQSSFGTEDGHRGNFEVVVLEGNDLVHYWHDNSNPRHAWTRGQVITGAATGPGCILQSDYVAGPHGNLEVVVQEGRQVAHYWHDSARRKSPWVKAGTFGSGVTGAPRIIQSDFMSTNGHGNFEVVVPEGSALVHYWKTEGGAWTRGATIATGVSSAGSIIQSDYSSDSGHGNFEVVVKEGDHLVHYWKDNSSPAGTWHRAGTFGTGATDAPSLLQSSFGTGSGGHGNLEVVSREGPNLVHHYKTASDPWARGQTVATGVNSGGHLLQSTLGTGEHGNFEVVVLGEPAPEPPDSRVEGGFTDYHLRHYWHDNVSTTSAWASGQTITYRGRSEKVCQVTGRDDKEQRWVTTNDTIARANLSATDLGYPVDDGTTLTLLYGDSRWGDGRLRATNELGGDDAVAVSTERTPPTMLDCLDMTLLADNGSFTLPRVVAPEIRQGLFNVPSSGFSAGGNLYGIFWTDHCDGFNSPEAEDDAPPHCGAGSNEHGRGVLTRRNSDGRTYTNLFTLPGPFTYTASFNSHHSGRIPPHQDLGVYVYGVSRYRADYPFLASAPANAVADPAAWKYFAGLDASENPRWTSDPAQARQLFTTGDPDAGCIGEFSVSWVPPLSRWLMLYNCESQPGGTVRARLAHAPWGSWSAPTDIFHPDTDAAACHFMHDSSRTCASLAGDNGKTNGAPYAPYVLTRFTRATSSGAEVYFLMSTWNPYQVVVMRTHLTPSP